MDRRRAAGLGLIETFLVKRVVGDEAQNLVGGEAERLQYQNGPAALPVDGWFQEGKRGRPIASVGLYGASYLSSTLVPSPGRKIRI
jgi:hypothetical protein